MRLGEPIYLWGLILGPALLLFFIFTERAKLKAMQKFSNLQLFFLLAESFSPPRARRKKILLLFSILLLAFCLARPQWGSQLVQVKKQGVDVVFALDVSLSMLAEDIPPNRLERAKLEVSDFLSKLKGDRVGLVAFAGAAYISCPLTLDYRAAQLFLDNVQLGVITKPGTNIAEAISTAALAFNQKENKYKVLVLVTDGEDQGNQPLLAAREATEQGLRIYTIGIGTPAGEPIPLRQPEGEFMGYKKDESGTVVLSRLDEEVLAEIAQIGNGKYLSPSRTGFDLDKIYQEVSGMEKKELKGTLAVEYLDRYQYFLLAAIMLLVWDLFFTDRRERKSLFSRFLKKEKALVATVLFILLITPFGWAKESPSSLNSKANQLYQQEKFQEAAKLYEEAAVEKPESFPLQYNLANALQQSQDYGQALNAYQKAIQTGDSGQLSQAYYNLGNNLFRIGEYQPAAGSYKKALELNPQDKDAKYNYELALKRFKEQSSQPQPQKNRKEQKPDQQEQQESQEEQQKQKQEQSQPQEPEQQKQEQSQKQDSNQAEEEKQNQSQKRADQSQLNKEEAERILDALEQKEKEQKLTQQKKALIRSSRGGKDW